MNFRQLTPIDARGTLEREAGAKNSDFMVIMGINQSSMERGIEWAAQMYPTSILPVENECWSVGLSAVLFHIEFLAF